MRRLLAIGGAMAMLAISGCGGGDSEPTTSTVAPLVPGAGGAPPAGESQFPPAFVKCMADKGVDVERSGIHGPGSEGAFNACLPFLHNS